MKRWRQKNLEFRPRGGRSSWCRTQTLPLRPSVPHRARPEHQKLTRSTHAARSRRLPVCASRSCLGALRTRLGSDGASLVSNRPLLGSSGSRTLLVEADDKTSLSRGLAGANDPTRTPANQRARPTGKCVERSVPCQGSEIAQRSATRDRVRPHELEEAPLQCDERRPQTARPAASFTGWSRPRPSGHPSTSPT